MVEWYYLKDGQQVGPVDKDALRRLAAGGGLGPADWVWNETMADWAPATSPAAGLFAPTPPRMVLPAAPAPAAGPPPLSSERLAATRHQPVVVQPTVAMPARVLPVPASAAPPSLVYTTASSASSSPAAARGMPPAAWAAIAACGLGVVAIVAISLVAVGRVRDQARRVQQIQAQRQAQFQAAATPTPLPAAVPAPRLPTPLPAAVPAPRLPTPRATGVTPSVPLAGGGARGLTVFVDPQHTDGKGAIVLTPKPRNATAGSPRMAGNRGVPAVESVQTPQVGGRGGGPVSFVSAQSLPVVGFRYKLGQWNRKVIIQDIEPFWSRPTGEPADGVIQAKDGYVVGGMIAGDDQFFRGFRVIFMRWNGQKPDPADQYTTDWFGLANLEHPTQLAGHGERVIGTCGRKGLNMDAFGLLLAPDKSDTGRAGANPAAAP